MVAEVIEQSPVLADALVQPRAVVCAELPNSVLRRAASNHEPQYYRVTFRLLRLSAAGRDTLR